MTEPQSICLTSNDKTIFWNKKIVMQYQKQNLGRDLHKLEDGYYNQAGIRTKPSLLDQPEIHLCT